MAQLPETLDRTRRATGSRPRQHPQRRSPPRHAHGRVRRPVSFPDGRRDARNHPLAAPARNPGTPRRPDPAYTSRHRPPRRPLRPHPPTINDSPITTSRARTARTRIEPVHPAWRVIGLQCRRLYETIIDETTNPANAFTAVGLGRTAGYTALATLTTTGLIHHTRNTVRAGTTTLDHIARAHDLPTRQQETIARHRHERARWADWLIAHNRLPSRAPISIVCPPPRATQVSTQSAGHRHHTERGRYQRTTQMRTPGTRHRIRSRPAPRPTCAQPRPHHAHPNPVRTVGMFYHPVLATLNSKTPRSTSKRLNTKTLASRSATAFMATGSRSPVQRNPGHLRPDTPTTQ